MPHRTALPPKPVKDMPVQAGQTESGLVFSPCCKKCKLLPDNTCGGCGRTIMEIAMWKSMSKAQRESVLERLRKAGTDL